MGLTLSGWGVPKLVGLDACGRVALFVGGCPAERRDRALSVVNFAGKWRGSAIASRLLASMPRPRPGRVPERLVPQIVRVLKTNQLGTIADDVVKAAASVLVIGTRDTKRHKTPPPYAETPLLSVHGFLPPGSRAYWQPPRPGQFWGRTCEALRSPRRGWGRKAALTELGDCPGIIISRGLPRYSSCPALKTWPCGRRS